MCDTPAEKPSRVLVVGWHGADCHFLSNLRAKHQLAGLDQLESTGTSLPLLPAPPFGGKTAWRDINSGLDARYYSADGNVPSVWRLLESSGLQISRCNWQDESYPSGNNAPTYQVKPEDIEADTIRLFMPDFAELDQKNDPAISILAHVLAKDFTTHSEVTERMENSDWDVIAVNYSGLNSIYDYFAPYTEPGLAGVSHEDLRLLSGIVPGMYRLLDLMLRRLLHLAPEETRVIVVSPHGNAINQARYSVDSDEKSQKLHSSPGIYFDSKLSTVTRFARPSILLESLLNHFDISYSRPPLPQIEPEKLSEIPAQELWDLVNLELRNQRKWAAMPLLLELRKKNRFHAASALNLLAIMFELKLDKLMDRWIQFESTNFPQMPLLKFLRAIREYEKKPSSEIEAYFDEVDKRDNVPDLHLMWIASAYYSIGMYKRSLSLLKKLLITAPLHSEALTLCAWCYYQQRQYNQAIDSALNALRQSYANEGAHFLLALIWFNEGKNDQSIQALKEALSANPNSSRCHRLLAILSAWHKQHDQAEKARADRKHCEQQTSTMFARLQEQCLQYLDHTIPQYDRGLQKKLNHLLHQAT